MPAILFAWELGAGMSHVANLRPLVQHFAQQGHRVGVALRDLSRASLLADLDRVALFQAPTKIRPAAKRIESAASFADVLLNVGFSDADELSHMVAAWRSVYAAFVPDLIVFEHSPTALLAAGGERAARVVLGPGFQIPSDQQPLPDLWPTATGSGESVRRQEGLLQTVNGVRQRLGLEPWQRWAQLYGDVDDTILTTFAELDPHERPNRPTYWGIMPLPAGAPVIWPAIDSRRVFAYLKPFPALPALLERLNRLALSTIVCSDGLDAAMITHFRSSSLEFIEGIADLRQVAQECDLAILNGNHTTTAAFLLAGRPILQVPITGEHLLTALRTTRMGCGLSAPAMSAEPLLTHLDRMLADESFSLAAQKFHRRYEQFDSQTAADGIAGRMTCLLSGDSLDPRESTSDTKSPATTVP